MGYFSGEYTLINVYMCASPFIPSGICYPEKCVTNGVSMSKKVGSADNAVFSSGFSSSVLSSDFITEAVSISVYLSDEDDEYTADVFIVPSEGDAMCLLRGLSCTAVTDAEADVSWEREGGSIRVKFPQIRSCGLKSIKTLFREGLISIKETNGQGEITSSLPVFTNNSDGYLDYTVSLSDTKLLPGMRSYVYYRMDGYEDEFLLGSYSFQTDIFTSAVIVGCGLTEKLKVYDDPSDPDSAYSYVHTPVEGGIGHSLADEWLFDTSLRWCVEYYGENYWLKSSFPCRLSNGTRIGILKSVSSLPDTIDTEITSTMAKTELSEASDRIVPDYFY